jgi:predicted Rossmann-fold nucleotide-binding protein
LGKAIAADGRSLIYGGGTDGIMGVVSTAAIEEGGIVTGIIPYAIRAGGGERAKVASDVTPDSDNELDLARKRVCQVHFTQLLTP